MRGGVKTMKMAGLAMRDGDPRMKNVVSARKVGVLTMKVMGKTMKWGMMTMSDEPSAMKEGVHAMRKIVPARRAEAPAMKTLYLSM